MAGMYLAAQQASRNPSKGVCTGLDQAHEHATKKSGHPDRSQVYKRGETATPRRRFTIGHDA